MLHFDKMDVVCGCGQLFCIMHECYASDSTCTQTSMTLYMYMCSHISDKTPVEDNDKRTHACLHDDSQLNNVRLIAGTKLTHWDFL